MDTDTLWWWGFPASSAGKESSCNSGDLGSVPGLGRSPGREHGNPLQNSCLENPHGQRRLAGYSPWGSKESHTAKRVHTHTHTHFGHASFSFGETISGRVNLKAVPSSSCLEKFSSHPKPANSIQPNKGPLRRNPPEPPLWTGCWPSIFFQNAF